MVKRKKIALTYYFSENWIAGAYYIINIIRSLKFLPERIQPRLYVFCSSNEGIGLLRDIQYPRIKIIRLDFSGEGWFSRTSKRVIRKFFGPRGLYRLAAPGVQHIFEGSELFDFIPHHYYWAHDFQQLRLPQFFTREEIEARSAMPAKVATLPDATLILSSEDARRDFESFFPQHRCRVRVLRFASLPPDFSHIPIRELRAKYDISKPYFICSNQFWQHKNHMTVLKALCMLSRRGNKDFLVLFTGKEYDYRNPDYFGSLKNFVRENSLEQQARFLGFIDRKEQLQLASHALSIIQPSLFEGWSTTVEDAKYMNQYVLLSDIPVHREQLDYNVRFFDPHQPAELASAMESVLSGDLKKETRDYNENILRFAHDIMDAFS